MKKNHEKPPWLGLWILKKILPSKERKYFVEGIEEKYRNIYKEKGSFAAKFWYIKDTIITVPLLVFNSISASLIMFLNYQKILLRNLRKYKGYSFINITGFAFGLACCILIFLYISFELSYDRTHPDGDRLYRIALHVENVNLETSAVAWTWDTIQSPGPLWASIKENIPQIENMTRIYNLWNSLIKYGDLHFHEYNAIYANQSILDLFDIKFIHGAAQGALTMPHSAVITQRNANKYFGREIPLGKILNIDGTDFTVTGVIENPPLNTHLKFGLLLSDVSGETTQAEYSNVDWHSFGATIYVRLYEGTDPKEIEKAFDTLWGSKKTQKYSCSYKYFLEPVKDIHLKPLFGNSSRLLNIYIFMAIGMLILSIASINFINLITARSTGRAKEIGIRKVVGAVRRQLISQFLSESLLMTGGALLASFPLVSLFLPSFNNLAGTEFIFSDLLRPAILVPLIFFTILLGFLSGIYPAFFLSSFKPAAVLKGRFKLKSSKSGLRKGLIVGQFTVSIILIIVTAFVYRQMHFMKNKDLGFDKEQKLIIPIKEGSKYETYKAEFLKLPGISGATASSDVPNNVKHGNQTRLYGTTDKKEQVMTYFYIDADFIPEYKMTLLAGRPPAKSEIYGGSLKCLINETALKSFGWSEPEEAIGRNLLSMEIEDFKNPIEIIGVIRDFHYYSVNSEIRPVVLWAIPSSFAYITMTVSTTHLKETLQLVKKKWETIFPGDVFWSYFLDSSFENLYRREENLGKIFTLFSALAIAISCLGLFGLAAFMSQQKTKEIGIRKTVGASVSSITVLMAGDFMKWILISAAIAFPIAFFAVTQWLQSFPYRINVDVIVFALSGLVVLALALITVSYHSIKAATANPINSLKYE